jgi:hypothetical protein
VNRSAVYCDSGTPGGSASNRVRVEPEPAPAEVRSTPQEPEAVDPSPIHRGHTRRPPLPCPHLDRRHRPSRPRVLDHRRHGSCLVRRLLARVLRRPPRTRRHSSHALLLLPIPPELLPIPLEPQLGEPAPRDAHSTNQQVADVSSFLAPIGQHQPPRSSCLSDRVDLYELATARDDGQVNRRTVRALVVVLGTIGILSAGSGVASAEPAAQNHSRASEPGCIWFWWIDRWICRDVDDPPSSPGHADAGEGDQPDGRRTRASEAERDQRSGRTADPPPTRGTADDSDGADARRTERRERVPG